MAVVLALGEYSASVAATLVQLDAIAAGSTSASDAPATKSVDLPGLPGAFREHAWILDTKYYSAHLRLWVQDAATIGAAAAATATADADADDAGDSPAGGWGFVSSPSRADLRAALAGTHEQVEGVVLAFEKALIGASKDAGGRGSKDSKSKSWQHKEPYPKL